MPKKHPPSTPKPASAAPCPPLPLNVQSTLDWIDTWTDLSETQQRDIRSALRSVARMVKLPPACIVLTPETLRTTLLSRSAADYGITNSTMRNILSNLRKVLRRADIIDTVKTTPSSQWQTLLAHLDIRKRAQVITFARFCTSRRIEPDVVRVATLTDFAEHLAARNLTRRGPKLVGSLRSFWNLAREKVPGWPQHYLEGGRTHDYIRPIGDFSESFQCDLAAFRSRLTKTVLDGQYDDEQEPLEGESLDADTDGFRPLRNISAELRQSHARWAASALVATGVPISDVTSLTDLVKPSARPKNILRFLYRRAGSKPSPAGMHVSEVLRMIAKYYVRLPNGELSEIKKWSKPVQLEYKGMTEKNAIGVREASTPCREVKLLWLPEALMADARRLLPTSPSQAKSLALRAMAIEILIKTPFRLGELIGLRLDQHLQRPDPKRRQISHVSILLHERKNSEPYSVSVSKGTGALLEEWLTTFRSIGASPDCVYLFPGYGTGNKSITPQGMRDAVKSVTDKRVGTKLPPHRFRHLAAHRILESHPGQYGWVQLLLGHRGIGTTQRHYAGRENGAAHLAHDELVLNRKAFHKPKGTKPFSPTKPRKPPGPR